MDMQYRLITAQVRLLADLMLDRTDFRDTDPNALALALQDLTARLERLTGADENRVS
ncbi:MAG: hypothetical protein KZQ76_10495 [Candidatus Thiodiazotropha sp. (ex Epidulcina cf. delphinae)]|nr:hypothetical protein [Candidatus Thiodiazotropha sp. (ex Epidulcina cf. delphinae)]